MCKRLDGRGTKRNSWGGCKLLRSGKHEQEWYEDSTIQRTEGRPDQREQDSDPVMSIELGLEEMVVNIMCAYAPQVGCIENEKETFW